MSWEVAVLAILAGITVGYWMYLRIGSGPGDTIYDVFATGSGIFWSLAGIFLILGGHVLAGLVVLILASYVAISNGSQVKAKARKRLSG